MQFLFIESLFLSFSKCHFFLYLDIDYSCVLVDILDDQLQELVLSLKFVRELWQVRAMGHLFLFEEAMADLDAGEGRRAGLQPLCYLFKVSFGELVGVRLDNVHKVEDGRVRVLLVKISTLRKREC